MKKVIGAVTGMLTSILANVLTFLLNLLLALAAMGIFYARGESLLGEVTALVPLPAGGPGSCSPARDGHESGGERGRADLLAQGPSGVGLLGRRDPFPAPLRTVMAFMGLIPWLGPRSSGSGVLYLFFTVRQPGPWGCSFGAPGGRQHRQRAAPLLIGGKAGMPLPLLIVGILGGLFSFGLMGLIIGPLVLTVLLFVLEEYHREVPTRRNPSPRSLPDRPRPRVDDAPPVPSATFAFLAFLAATLPVPPGILELRAESPSAGEKKVDGPSSTGAEESLPATEEGIDRKIGQIQARLASFASRRWRGRTTPPAPASPGRNRGVAAPEPSAGVSPRIREQALRT